MISRRGAGTQSYKLLMISMLCIINELLCVSAPLRENVFVLFTHPIGFVYSMFSRIIALSCGMLMNL